jgi:hypothetical protein
VVPSAADIVRYRCIAAAVIRGIGLLMLLYAAARVGVHLWDSYWATVGTIAAGAPTRSWLAALPKLHMVLGAVAIVMFTRSSRIARVLVPWTADAACPRCRFSLESFQADLCPECGLHLGPSFHAPPPPAGTGPGGPAPVQSPDVHPQ